jgi:hypothetical protein
VIGKAALDRGYSVLIYEGPGQGEPLRKYGIYPRVGETDDRGAG